MITVEAGIVDNSGRNSPDHLVIIGPSIRVIIEHVMPSVKAPAQQKQDSFVAGLIDTGAYHSCIDTSFATELGLPIVNEIFMGGAAGLSKHNVYLAKMHIPDLQLDEYGEFAGVDLAGGGQLHRALLGRTFLRNLMMIYHGTTGQVMINKMS